MQCKSSRFRLWVAQWDKCFQVAKQQMEDVRRFVGREFLVALR